MTTVFEQIKALIAELDPDVAKADSNKAALRRVNKGLSSLSKLAKEGRKKISEQRASEKKA